MQFISNGPDIPEALLQAHEDGCVVFLCGAGISYPAGLRGFKELVDDIYQGLYTKHSDSDADEQKAYDRGQFDVTLNLLERRIPGQRDAVLQALAQALQPKLDLEGATDTHTALLQLARSREGELRLVTTNFDRIFEHAAKQQAHNEHVAPMLPIPKNGRWKGLVYLHGLLPADPDDSAALHRLVFTSGDFGRAYLTERWAANFVSELFRNYVVCFVGYSINDPVLRYMMDALATDRVLDEGIPQASALGDCEPGQELSKTNEWKAKGVTPILYKAPEIPAGGRDHSALHQTLKAWAEIYCDGVRGKKSIVDKYAHKSPSESTEEDNFVGRMLWALSDESGLPAKRFAELDPVPPLEWLLTAFSEERFRHGDLSRFGIPARAPIDPKLRFSLTRRPTPYSYAPWMVLVGRRFGSEWDKVMLQIAHWLLRHLDDPQLIHWLSERGGQLHDRWHRLLEGRLDHLASLERDGKTRELSEIRTHAPNAIPRPMMRTLWRLLLAGRIKSPSPNLDLYGWKRRLKRDGLRATLRLELRELLAPMIALEKPFPPGYSLPAPESSERLSQLVDWELVLVADHAHDALQDLADDEHWQQALPALLDDFQQLLCDALGLLREIGEATDRSDRSHWRLPSISPHLQNQESPDWATLIELLRDAWLNVRPVDPARATRGAQAWFELPYPAFKRLAFFAASQDGCIAPEQWVDWPLADRAWWLWHEGTQREVLRLFVLQGRHISSVQDRFEAAILLGPPREVYEDELKPERWQNQAECEQWLHQEVERSVWLRLAKLQQSGLGWGDAGRERLAELSAAHPQWQWDANERDEFPHWISATGDPDYEERRHIDVAPRKRRELVQWLKQPPAESRPFYGFYEDTWHETCRTRFFHSLLALCDLAQEKIWPSGHWRRALQVWSEEKQVQRSWRYAAPLVQTMPDDALNEIADGVTWWLRNVSQSITRHESILLNLCHRVLELPLEPGSDNNSETIKQPLIKAINHPIGHVTQALLNLWLKRAPNDNDGLPADIKPFFTQICDTQVDRLRHGRVLLASRSIALFRADRSWTEQHLLPLFRWTDNPVQAKAAWEGFLWSARLYWPLLIAFKPQFLETAHHYDEMGDQINRQFVTLLTYAALEPIEEYTAQEFQSAIMALPQEGRQEVAQVLVRALKGAGEQRENYWRNRILPFWQNIWPKRRNLASSHIADSLARMSIAAGGEFPTALDTIKDWLQPIEYPHYVVHQLHGSGLCRRFPKEALDLLHIVIRSQQSRDHELEKCLNEIKQAAPELERDPRYQQLRAYLL